MVFSWATIFWVSQLTPHLRVCDRQIAQVGSRALVEDCHALKFADAQMISLVAIALLLLLPDVAALEVPGIFRLERKLEEQGRRQEEILAKMQQITNVHVYQNRDPLRTVQIMELVSQQDEKRQQFESNATESE